MKKVLVLSRFNYRKFIETLTEKQKQEIAFIQINEVRTDPEMFTDSSKPIQDSNINVLNLHFDDAEEQFELLDGSASVLFDEAMAESVIQFVSENISKDLWVIHCTAGQCRSGAVGEVLSDYFGIPYQSFIRTNPQVKPNILVKNVLRRQLFGN